MVGYTIPEGLFFLRLDDIAKYMITNIQYFLDEEEEKIINNKYL